ncbi:MAG: OmpA family protein [Flavobacteriaceae bacterium]|nr:OmpA family protein [Flavobacteriaceae bacterium]
MNKIKILGLSFVLLFSASVNAQEKSEIVMTKAELESFLNTVAETRRAQIRAQKEQEAKRYLNDLRAHYKTPAAGQEISNYEILREIDRLNARLDLISRGNSDILQGRGSNSTIVVPGGAQGGISYLPGQNPQYIVPSQPLQSAPVTSDRDLETARSIWELEKKLDSLKAERAQQNLAPKDNLGELKQQFLTLEERLAAAQNPTERRSLLEELLAKFKNFKKQVFFPNNVSDLSAADYAYISDVSDVLKNYPELSVVLEGFASPRGSADYNKQLSMRRSESVERALLDKGISKERIVSSFRGEDHSTSEAGARRVDMSIILK